MTRQSKTTVCNRAQIILTDLLGIVSLATATVWLLYLPVTIG